MTNISYKFGNNFENESGAVSVSVPAIIENEGQRGTVPPVLVAAGEEYVSFSIPANTIIKNFYLVVAEAMVGTVTVYLGTSSGTALFTAAVITATGLTKSSVEDAYVTTPTEITLVFSDAQTAGEIKLAFDLLFLETNTAKYVGR